MPVLPSGMRDFLTGSVRMEGLDWPEEGGNKPHILALHLELPLSLFRWLTIPSSDEEWDRRRRLWSALCPPLLGLLWLIEFAGDVPSALTQPSHSVATRLHPSMPATAPKILPTHCQTAASSTLASSSHFRLSSSASASSSLS